MYAVLQFTEKEICKATGNFAEDAILGSGGFGVVYKGMINGTNVAVKKLTEESIYNYVTLL